MLPGVFFLDGNANVTQGVPDLFILWRDTWAALEVKASRTAKRQPNQPYYVDYLNWMSFARFVNPSNKAEVLRALQLTFHARRPARLPVSQQLALDELRRRQAPAGIPEQSGSETRDAIARTRAQPNQSRRAAATRKQNTKPVRK